MMVQCNSWWDLKQICYKTSLALQSLLLGKEKFSYYHDRFGIFVNILSATTSPVKSMTNRTRHGTASVHSNMNLGQSVKTKTIAIDKRYNDHRKTIIEKSTEYHIQPQRTIRNANFNISLILVSIIDWILNVSRQRMRSERPSILTTQNVWENMTKVGLCYGIAFQFFTMCIC